MRLRKHWVVVFSTSKYIFECFYSRIRSCCREAVARNTAALAPHGFWRAGADGVGVGGGGGGGGVQQLIVNCLLYHAMHIHSDSES